MQTNDILDSLLETFPMPYQCFRRLTSHLHPWPSFSGAGLKDLLAYCAIGESNLASLCEQLDGQ